MVAPWYTNQISNKLLENLITHNFWAIRFCNKLLHFGCTLFRRGKFCHNLLQNWCCGIQTVEVLTIPDVPRREACIVREFRSHIATDILKKVRTVSGFFCELLRYVLAEVPVELDQRGIDGDRRLDLHCTVSALEVGNPHRVGLRLPAALHKSRACRLRYLLHVSSPSNSVSVSTAGKCPCPRQG